jgi:hypothetical protein
VDAKPLRDMHASCRLPQKPWGARNTHSDYAILNVALKIPCKKPSSSTTRLQDADVPNALSISLT